MNLPFRERLVYAREKAMRTAGAVQAHAHPGTRLRLLLAASAVALTSCPSETASRVLASEFEPTQGLTRGAAKLAARQLLVPQRGEGSAAEVQPASFEPVAPVPSPTAEKSAEADSPNPEEQEAPEDVERVLVSIGRETWVYAEPRTGARRIGYLRFGAVVGRARQPASRDDCPQGWYRISPDGYACNNGRTATVDLENRLASMGRQRPDRLSGLPYVYGVPRSSPPPLYARLPTRDEQQSVEPNAPNTKPVRDWEQFSMAPLPNWLRQTANVFGYPRDRSALLLGTTVARSAFSLLGLFEEDGRAFGLTADLALVPLGKLRPVQASRFHGMALDEQHGLPVVFNMRSAAGVYAGDPSQGKLTLQRQASYREAFSVTGRELVGLGSRWIELQGGEWMRDEKLVHVQAPANWPSWAVAGRTWIDVTISTQTLIAFDGTKPLYVTLVSTGAAGLEDPHKTTATKRGTFQIGAKHVTATMDGNEPGHEFDLRDVPWVQYFTEGYALHAAYWHDDFGRPRSHGCVNLSPLDARWLFHFTTPAVPQTWHGALANGQSSIVNVHP